MRLKQKITINRLLLLFAVVIFLFIFPWTKNITIFRAENITWSILKSAVKTNEFDSHSFSFVPNYQLNDKIKKLNKKEIIIEGFFKKEEHKIGTEYILTETVTEVCFACDHDTHYNMIQLIPDAEQKIFFDILPNDTLIKVKGIFQINNKKNAQYVFLLKNAHLEKFKK